MHPNLAFFQKNNILQDDGKYDFGTTYDTVLMPDAQVPVHTIKGLKIGLKEIFED
jgi:hypothetical protein